MRKYQKAGIMKSINDYLSLQKHENKLSKENVKEMLNNNGSFWKSQSEFEDNFSVMNKN